MLGGDVGTLPCTAAPSEGETARAEIRASGAQKSRLETCARPCPSFRTPGKDIEEPPGPGLPEQQNGLEEGPQGAKEPGEHGMGQTLGALDVENPRGSDSKSR